MSAKCRSGGGDYIVIFVGVRLPILARTATYSVPSVSGPHSVLASLGNNLQLVILSIGVIKHIEVNSAVIVICCSVIVCSIYESGTLRRDL